MVHGKVKAQDNLEIDKNQFGGNHFQIQSYSSTGQDVKESSSNSQGSSKKVFKYKSKPLDSNKKTRSEEKLTDTLSNHKPSKMSQFQRHAND